MKVKLFLAAIAICALTVQSYGQFSFGVSPGKSLNSAYFGYKINNKIVPFIGFQYLNADFKFEQSGEHYDYDLNQMASYVDISEFSGSLYIPNLGLKYFFIQQNKIQAYMSVNFSRPILNGTLSFNEEEDEEIQEYINSVSMWGGEFGLGVEYFFDENFSVGGEFGVRYLHFDYKRTHDRDVYNPDIGEYQESEIVNDFIINMSPTFSKISLNFYF